MSNIDHLRSFNKYKIPLGFGGTPGTRRIETGKKTPIRGAERETKPAPVYVYPRAYVDRLNKGAR